ncbi:MAG: outer membrane beta-barrel protein [Alphaproteobacteria bacterium]|nr:outer membrane beta-barrel protein [Alphaproteobacteria bacterium]
MKKILLLAGVATMVTMNAKAFDMMNIHDIKPYVGMDYIYSYADYKDVVRKPKRNYNSIEGNFGMQMWKYFGPEFYYQYAFKRTSFTGDERLKNRFFSYGMDMMGYLPLGCEGIYNLLGSVGLGGYNVKTSQFGESNDTNKVGYRFGLGAMYNFTDNMSLRLMGRYSYVGTRYLDNLWEMTAGLRYTF